MYGAMTVFPEDRGISNPGCTATDSEDPSKLGLPPLGFPGDASPSSIGSLVAIVNCENQEQERISSHKMPERHWATALQVAVPFIIAGAGTIGAGLVLGQVTKWPVFQNVSEVLILVPALLGLKGNLDMCLASRLSTQANLGNMVNRRDRWHHIVGNIALVQVQAVVCALLVAMFAVSLGAIVSGTFIWRHALLLAAASVITSTTSCLVLDFVMIAVILISRRLHVNPDNVATPLAASVGDVVSITLLANIASLLYVYIDTLYWILVLIVIGYILLVPMWVSLVVYLKHTKAVLLNGWIPVLSALLISGLGGLVLNVVTDPFPGYVVFQPIINGIGGNLVSVQSSRLSTRLHQTSILGTLPADDKQVCRNPCAVLLWGSPSAPSSRILLAMSIPGHIVFALLADYIYSRGMSTVSTLFVSSYLFVSVLQVAILLYLAHILVHIMWRWKVDPDNSSIPYLTALGDLLGSSLLALAFLFLRAVGHNYRDHN